MAKTAGSDKSLDCSTVPTRPHRLGLTSALSSMLDVTYVAKKAARVKIIILSKAGRTRGRI